MSDPAAVRRALADASSAERAEGAARYFQTGPGEYGEGDVFIGVTMPSARAIAKRFSDLADVDLDALLQSEIHEYRMTALIIMVLQFERAPSQRAVDDYLRAARAGYVNNWDLVDASAEYIVGAWLFDRPRGQLFALAKSDIVWERRIAIVATLAFLRRGDASTTLEIAERLLRERHPLIQKAVGWLLREVGKRVDRDLLVEFLDRNAPRMPRTTLTYATEHLEQADRERYRALPRVSR